MSSGPDPPTASQLTADGIQHALQDATLKSAGISELDASRIRKTFTDAPKSVPGLNSPELKTQKICTDHMITCRWTVSKGWEAPELKPYGPLSLMPTASCLHYATECFEGMKLYRGFDGKLRLFRPTLNAARMLGSATRIALPAFQPSQLLRLIEILCATDGAKWLPEDRAGSFLYVRPTMIASDPALGVQKPNEATLFIILACFASMDNTEGLKLLASRDDMCRAWPGGFGWAKVGANYGPTLMSQGEARARGFDQVLWLLGAESLVTEAGASNFFVVWKTPDGVIELVTAPLGDKIILDGVTRRSVLELAQDRLSSKAVSSGNHDPVRIVERSFTMQEVATAAKEGRLLEAFACGTAWFVAGVRKIEWREQTIQLEIGDDGCGTYTRALKTWLKDIMYGKMIHVWGHVIETSKV